ncbi:MAG: hypothetical protein ACYTBJ_06070 [Planctomycetota bacterium]|jgi:hypothetical protein
MKRCKSILSVITVIGFLCFGCKKHDKDDVGANADQSEKTAVETETIDTSPGQSEETAERTKTVSIKPDESKKTIPEQMLIEPGVGVGEIRLGMSIDDMTEILSDPDHTWSMESIYSSLGISVVSRDSESVESIKCGHLTNKLSPLVSACKYRTKEGIGMGASKEDIIRAYGEPSIRRGAQLIYKERGILFVLAGDKVICIWVSKPS